MCKLDAIATKMTWSLVCKLHSSSLQIHFGGLQTIAQNICLWGGVRFAGVLFLADLAKPSALHILETQKGNEPDLQPVEAACWKDLYYGNANMEQTSAGAFFWSSNAYWERLSQLTSIFGVDYYFWKGLKPPLVRDEQKWL